MTTYTSVAGVRVVLHGPRLTRPLRDLLRINPCVTGNEHLARNNSTILFQAKKDRLSITVNPASTAYLQTFFDVPPAK
jgi:hypothetical protein